MTIATTTTTQEDAYLEKRFIVGTLALDSNLDIAACARVLLKIEDSISDCAKLTADCRALFGPGADSPQGP